MWSCSVPNVKAVIYWHRNDLRLQDNPALYAASSVGVPLIPVYLNESNKFNRWSEGAASRWWLHHSLKSLKKSYQSLGSRLLFRECCNCYEEILALAEEVGASEIFCTRRYEPYWVKGDSDFLRQAKAKKITLHFFNSFLLTQPDEVKSKSGNAFRIFTPFWKSILNKDLILSEDQLLAGPTKIKAPQKWPKGVSLTALKLLPEKKWQVDFSRYWAPGETGGHLALQDFLSSGSLDNYADGRNIPSQEGTSNLSPYLHHGEVSIHRVWHELSLTRPSPQPKVGLSNWHKSLETFKNQLGWREFSNHLLVHFPESPQQPLRSEFKKFPWRAVENKKWKAWTLGQTGFPIVDAGMRELWQTGWMHNRVRMIVASFLVKDLRYSWIKGAEWFWDTLVDADLANNTLGWQWSAGCGADAAPYFRIFNPELQGKRFDPDGRYVARWCPELSKVPARWIHRLQEAPSSVLLNAGVVLGKDYPHPMLAHSEERLNALNAFKALQSSKKKMR